MKQTTKWDDRGHLPECTHCEDHPEYGTGYPCVCDELALDAWEAHEEDLWQMDREDW